MDPDAILAEQLEIAGRILGGTEREDDLAGLAHAVVELDVHIRGGGDVPAAWKHERCRMRWALGVLFGPDRDPRHPTAHARCKLPKGHPTNPDDVFGGHVWGDDNWPEYPGGKPPERRKSQ